jgi:hypothetical protein
MPVGQYKAELLSPSRLNNRQEIFSKLTLPSLIALNASKSADVELTVQIVTSEDLPATNKDFLGALVREHDFIEVKYHSYTKASVNRDLIEYVEGRVKEGEMYASVRLDDDDALSVAWMEEISRHLIPTFDDYVLSLASGLGVVLNEKNEITDVSRVKIRCCGIGLAYISRKKNEPRYVYSIFQCSSHSKIDDKYRTVIYAKGDFYIRTYNTFNDSLPVRPAKDIVSRERYLDEFKKFNIQAIPFEVAPDAGAIENVPAKI